MTRYIISFPRCRDRSLWSDLVRISKLLSDAGIDVRPNLFHSTDDGGVQWMLPLTPEKLTMLLLKTGAEFVREVEDPWTSDSNIPF